METQAGRLNFACMKSMCVHVSKYVSVFVSSMLVQPRGLPIANRFVDRGALLCSL